jgi:hypothetical protein
LTGQQPFPAATVEQLLTAHLASAPPRPSAIRPDVPTAFDAVIAKGMAKDPGQRYGSAIDLGRAARAALATADRPTMWGFSTAKRPNFAPGQPTPWWRRKAIAIPAAVLSIAGVAITAIALAIHARDASAYQASLSASAEASRSSLLSSSASASAATSRLRESQQQRVLTTQAVRSACDSLANSSKDAIDKVNVFVAAYNQGHDTAPTKAPAIDALNNSADVVTRSITPALSAELRDDLNAYSDSARGVANAMSSGAPVAEFNKAVDQLNGTKGKALTLCVTFH